MKRKHILTIILSVLLLAVAVAAGVHILHRKAYADTRHCVIVRNTENEPIENARVKICILINANPEIWANTLEFTDINGKVTAWDDPCAEAVYWLAIVQELPQGYRFIQGQSYNVDVPYPNSEKIFIVEVDDDN